MKAGNAQVKGHPMPENTDPPQQPQQDNYDGCLNVGAIVIGCVLLIPIAVILIGIGLQLLPFLLIVGAAYLGLQILYIVIGRK
jgi:hypothetical protein